MVTSVAKPTLTKLLGVDEERLQELVTKHIIPKAKDGKHDLVSSVQGYIKYLRDRIRSPKLDDISEQENNLRLLKAQTIKAELELQYLVGDVVLVEDVEHLLLDMLTRFRTKMLAIPYRAAVAIKEPKNFESTRKILKELLDDAFDSLTAEIKI